MTIREDASDYAAHVRMIEANARLQEAEVRAAEFRDVAIRCYVQMLNPVTEFEDTADRAVAAAYAILHRLVGENVNAEQP